MKDIRESSKLIVFMITSILFGLSYFIGVTKIIIGALSFLILLEIIRTIYDYITKPEHRVKVRYIVDGGILFGMRELFVGWIMLKSNTLSGIIFFGSNIPAALIGLFIMSISLLVIGILIFYRYKVIQSSPDKLEKRKNNEKTT